VSKEEILAHVARLDLARKQLERELAPRIPSVDADFYYGALDRLTAAWALRLLTRVGHAEGHQACMRCQKYRKLADALVADLGEAGRMV